MKRQPGLDVFRICGLLFVNALHACLYNGFYALPQAGVAVWAADSFRWLFFGCNAMFMLLTGYLKSAQTWNKRYYKGLVTVLVGYVLTCIISYPIRYYCIGERDALEIWLERFFTFSNYSWYVEMYIGLILVSPLLNFALQHFDTKKLLVLAGSFVAVTIAHSITAMDLIPDYFSSLYPLTLYFIGGVIRRLQPKIPACICLGGAAAVAMGLGAVSLLTASSNFNSGFGQGYGGFWITAMVALLFCGVYRLQAKEKTAKLLAWLSGGVFEGYILSRLFDVWIYNTVPQWHSPDKYLLIFVCITLPVFLVSLLAGKAVHTLSVQIVNVPIKLFAKEKIRP